MFTRPTVRFYEGERLVLELDAALSPTPHPGEELALVNDETSAVLGLWRVLSLRTTYRLRQGPGGISIPLVLSRLTIVQLAPLAGD